MILREKTEIIGEKSAHYHCVQDISLESWHDRLYIYRAPIDLRDWYGT
jgi:hypothetical protein